MPSTDVCQGKTCQMNMIATKDSPVKAKSDKNATTVSSFISISFESTEASSDSEVTVKQIKVRNLTQPIKMEISVDTTKMNKSLT